MKYTSLFWRAFVALALVSASGCGEKEGNEGEEALGALESSITSINRLTMNHLQASSLGVTKLSTEALSIDGLTLAQNDLLKSKNRRDVLTYLVKCALPVGTTLSGSSGGKSYTFSGLIGLAPEWLNAPLSASGGHWVSGCILAHINGYNDEVHISLRGDHPALATSAAERAAYGVEEMSFYGDIFGQDDDLLYACAGEGPQASCPADPDEYRPQRSCDEDEPCLLHVPGPCHDITLSGDDACEGGAAGLSSGCHPTTRPNGQAWATGDPAYLEVVTVYMNASDFEDYYECGGGGIVILGIEL
jgi:hypothetical protein